VYKYHPIPVPRSQLVEHVPAAEKYQRKRSCACGPYSFKEGLTRRRFLSTHYSLFLIVLSRSYLPRYICIDKRNLKASKWLRHYATGSRPDEVNEAFKLYQTFVGLKTASQSRGKTPVVSGICVFGSTALRQHSRGCYYRSRLASGLAN
jgi:hypothetical protein